MSDSSKSSSNYSCPEFNDPKLEICMNYQENMTDSKQFHSIDFTTMSQKDNSYWEKRRKNNAAAKRSRERRRQQDMEMERKIHELQLKNQILQEENLELRRHFKHYNIAGLDLNNLSNFTDPKILINSLPNHDDKLSKIRSYNLSSLNSAVTYSNNVNVPSLTLTTSSLSRPLDLTNKPSDNQFSPDSSFSLPSCQTFPSRSKPKVDIQDERYWDRRKRNNEAVRKCRRNKKNKLLNAQFQANNHNVNNNNNNNNNNNGSIAINSNNDNLLSRRNINYTFIPSSHTSLSLDMPKEQKLESVFTTYDTKKPMKWKNKLIEANRLMS